MLAIVNTCAVVGIDARIVEVQVDFNPHGLPSFTIVGLPNNGVQESRERVRSAIRNSNRSTARRLCGQSLLGADGLTITRPNKNRRENEEQGFGLLFPNKRAGVKPHSRFEPTKSLPFSAQNLMNSLLGYAILLG
jgi:hypothetical protein